MVGVGHLLILVKHASRFVHCLCAQTELDDEGGAITDSGEHLAITAASSLFLHSHHGRELFKNHHAHQGASASW